MSSLVKVKNTKISSDVWCGQTILPGEYFEIPSSYLERWREDVKVFQDIANGNLIVNNGETDYINPVDGRKYLEDDMPQNVTVISEYIIDWTTLKNYFDSNVGAYLNYIELANSYYIWLCFRSQKMFLPDLVKNTAECIDFETNYKSKCNLKEAEESRIRTCKYGRKQHCRFITLVTSTQNSYDNTNYLDVDYGDVTYTMIDSSKNVTTNNAEAKETWIDWMPNYSYEIRGGSVYIPTELVGNLDLWEIHVVGAPEIPQEYGGSLQFLANPRIKWNRGLTIECNSELDPADVTYYPGLPANKIRFIFKHPVAAQVEFQIHLNLYKDS